MTVVPYRIPNASEREVLFHWLKAGSSWTGWRLLFEKHRVFSAIVEKAFRADQANPRADGKRLIPKSWMGDVWLCEAAFDAALTRLRRGDRRCFLFLGASGHFYEGTREAGWWKEMDGRERYMSGGEFPPNQSPFWPEMERALGDFLAVFSDLGVVLQTRHTDVPAPIENMDDYRPSDWAALVSRVPSHPMLARVPTPPDPPVYVKTRRTVPEDGIWEPVVSKDNPQIDGLMNYLHGGQPAPTIAFAGDGQRQEGRPTTWHLIWPDRRYGDKPIPEEEKTYQFSTTP